MMAAAPLVSYHTSNLYSSDIRLLSSGCWLNDAIMNFAWDWEQHHEFQQYESRLRFIPPGPAFILLHEDDEDDLRDTLSGCDISSTTELVLLCINDNPHKTGAGGSHWSLLVYVMKTKTWHSFDSAGSSNSHVAWDVAEKLTPYMHGDEKSEDKLTKKNFIHEKCPQQANGYDCGVYAIALAHHIATCWVSGESIEEMSSTLHKTITPAYVTKYREVIREHVKQAQKNS